MVVSRLEWTGIFKLVRVFSVSTSCNNIYSLAISTELRGSMAPQLGRTQYFFGAVVLILKRIFLSVGFFRVMCEVTGCVNGPAKKYEIYMWCELNGIGLFLYIWRFGSGSKVAFVLIFSVLLLNCVSLSFLCQCNAPRTFSILVFWNNISGILVRKYRSRADGVSGECWVWMSGKCE